jgi:hypothetical protein
MGRNNKHAVVQLETMSRSAVWCIVFLFLSTFTLFTVLGADYGPAMYKTKQIADEHVTGEHFDWTVRIRSMTQKHRNLDITAAFRAKHIKLHFASLKKDFVWMDQAMPAKAKLSVCGLSEQQVAHYNQNNGATCAGTQLLLDYDTAFTIKCVGKVGEPATKELEAEEWCHSSHLLHFTEVAYAGYDVRATFDGASFGSEVDEVRFDMRYGNVAETYYLMGFKYCFVGISVLAFAMYSLVLGETARASWSVEQEMLRLLAGLLVLFNDPFYALEEWKASAALGVLSVLFQTTFVAALLLFWLILVDHIRVDAKEQRIVRRSFYPAKLAFVGMFWLAALVTECYNLKKRRDNPAYNIHIHRHVYVFFKVLAHTFVALYVAWMACMVLALFTEIRSLSRRFQFLLLFSGVMGVIVIGGVVLQHEAHLNHNMGEVTGYYSLFNLYVYTMCYLYAPSREMPAAYGQVTMSAHARELPAPGGRRTEHIDHDGGGGDFDLDLDGEAAGKPAVRMGDLDLDFDADLDLDLGDLGVESP